MTGLYPETTGIVSNDFYDPLYNQTVELQGPSGTEVRWWNNTDPIWYTAKQQVDFFCHLIKSS